MENKLDFKNELITKANRLKNKKLIGMAMKNLLLVLTGIYISMVHINQHSQSTTTNIGFLLAISAMAIYVIVSNDFLPILFRMNKAQDNNEYLKDLFKIKNKQQFLQSTIMNLYFALLTTGICLYMIEYTSKMPILWAIAAYSITLAWIAFNWFYVRPKSIKKQENNLNEMIRNIESVSQQ